VVTRWFKEKERLRSPKFFVGESYGGFRGPLLARKLQDDQGLGFSGLVLLSPVIDFSLISQPRWSAMAHVARLPSLAAAALEAKGPVTRELLADAERYAAGEYLVDLTRGLADPAAVARVSERVAGLTGLDPGLVRRLAGRVDISTFQREYGREEARVASAYDTGVSSFDPDPTAARSNFEDPGLSGMTAPLTSAIVDHLTRTLGWRVENARYELLNGAVNGAWRWPQGRGQTESVGALRQAMALDENLRVLVVHGFTDLVTPYFASKLVLDQLPPLGPEPRATLAVYPGGHMFYSRDESRRRFREDGAALYREALVRRGDPQAEGRPQPRGPARP
jgi:carboxypeptidase C (cathepsin A)